MNTDTPDSSLDQNIDSVLEVRKREREQRSSGQRFVERISVVIGRPLYLVALFVFVAGWIAYNCLAPHWDRTPFDAAPFALLEGIVSLAALISTTVVLIAQNRLTRIEQQHAHIALQVNLMTEQKVTKLIGLLEELRRVLPMVKDRYDAEAASFTQKTDALEVLSAIEQVGLTKGPLEEADSPSDDQTATTADRPEKPAP
jgi:uncharacterized membrane protein